MDRKYKKTAWLTASLMLMASLPAVAAGLGKLTVTSTLGQPFRGEIDLLAVDRKDLGSLRARFASFEAFKEAKIERASVLSAMQFSVEQKKNGDPYLKITSTKPVDEPFLDMLIELDWPAGRLVREYTVLLDPPGYAEQQAEIAPVAAPVVVKPVSAASAQVVSAQTADMPTGAMKPETRARIPQDKKPLEEAKAVAAGEGKPAGETYGPVRKGEYLAGIASALKPDGVSLEQMLVALYQSNKQAFAGNNMNRLKAGQILRVPEAGHAEEVKTSEAAKQVKAHSADWHAYRQKLASAVAEAKPAQEEAAKQAVSGKITTAVEDKATAAKESATDVLKLSKSEGLGGAKPAAAVGVGKDMQAMKGQIQAMQEEATAKEKAIKEANQRISDLEKNIKEMQKLLELKNQNLADLQKQAAASKAVPAALPAPAVSKPEEKPAVPAAEQKMAAAVAEKPPVGGEKPVAKPKQPKPVVAEQKKPEPSFLDEAMENPLYLGGGAAVVLLLGLLGAKALASRRKKSVASFEDSILTHGDLKANTVMGGAGGGKVDTGDTSFLTDFSQAGLGAIDTNEVDPIAEAEVYMAYGRDAQAEEILKEALIKDPNRHEIRLKLLEIYAGRNNLNAFEAVAGEMYAALGGQASPIWDKAAEMGRTLDPQNPLYGEQSKLAVAKPVAIGEENIFDETMPEAGGAAGLASEEEHGATLDLGGPEITEAAESDLDFNLDIAAPTVQAAPDALLSETAEESVPAEEVATDLGFDLDLGALTGAVTQAAQPEVSSVAEAEEPAADMGLDFNLDLGAPTVTEVAPEPAGVTMESEESAMEFDLGALTQTAPAAPAEELISADSWKEEVMGLDVGGLTETHGTEPVGAMEEVEEKLEMPDFAIGEEVAPAGQEMESIELAALPASESSLDFDFNLDQGETPAAAEVKSVAAPDLDLSGINLDMGEPVSAKPELAGLPDDFGSQEVSTKLDLARAYIDMGDVEGARDILQEVLKEGVAEQQEEARKLLAELG